MEKYGSLRNIQALVFDIDNTCYSSPAYDEMTMKAMMAGVGEFLGLSTEEAVIQVEAKRSELKANRGTTVTLTDSVLNLGLTRAQWRDIRVAALKPEGLIGEDKELTGLLEAASQKYILAFGTNSPEVVGRQIMALIGLPKPEELNVVGADSFEFSKPDVDFFRAIAIFIGVTPNFCLSIGDRYDIDCAPALVAGYSGAVHVPGKRDETVAFLQDFLARY